ncbi:MAG: hypothetical protein ACREMY_14830 [bacterium]
MEGNPWIAGVFALSGTIVGGFLQYLTTRWLWERQQAHTAREKHYLDLLGNLTSMRTSLEDQISQFDGPEPEYATPPDAEYFARLQQLVAVAIGKIRQLMGAARLFLTDGAVAAIEQLEEMLYHAGEDAGPQYDYVCVALKAAERAYDIVLAEARKATRPKN